ncbi:hypothetical protein LR48_Vigan07g199300 [Vigna angularis]|uniref:Uncharacterized protein n=1 Tax=Phaseolus angularis TaxID=3914 RepID=A0A0L9V0K4_PHAAN|nr:hypothetical protein LR48_Vigan07g199300 [Vigna angularis]
MGGVDFIFRGTGSAYGVANFVLGLEEWISSGVFREKGGATRIKMESTIVHDAINWEAARWRINRRAPAHIWFGFGGSAQGSWMERPAAWRIRHGPAATWRASHVQERSGPAGGDEQQSKSSSVQNSRFQQPTWKWRGWAGSAIAEGAVELFIRFAIFHRCS